MNSADIKPWRERLPKELDLCQDAGLRRKGRVFEAVDAEISDLRQSLVAAEKIIRGIAEAKRFDRATFEDADAFVDWAQSLCRHHLEKP